MALTITLCQCNHPKSSHKLVYATPTPGKKKEKKPLHALPMVHGPCQKQRCHCIVYAPTKNTVTVDKVPEHRHKPNPITPFVPPTQEQLNKVELMYPKGFMPMVQMPTAPAITADSYTDEMFQAARREAHERYEDEMTTDTDDAVAGVVEAAGKLEEAGMDMTRVKRALEREMHPAIVVEMPTDEEPEPEEVDQHVPVVPLTEVDDDEFPFVMVDGDPDEE